MNILIVLLTIISITLIGYIIIRGFGFLSGKDNLLAIGYSYGLGAGLIAMQLYVYSRLHIPWHLELLGIPWIILIVWLLFKKKKYIFGSFPKIPNLGVIDKLLILGIVITLGYVLFEALLRPVTAWDSWATWMLRAKVFFIDQGVYSNTLNYVQSDYPLLFSLLGTFIYIVLGKVNDTAVLLISFAYYFFLSLTFFAVIKGRYGMRYALLFTFLFMTVQNLVRHGGRLEAGMADLPFGYYTFISTLLFIEYIKSKSSKILFLLSIFLACVTLIKVEGVFISIVITLLCFYTIYKNKFKNFKHLFILLFWIIPFAEWIIYRSIYIEKFPGHELIFSASKLINAFSGTLKELFNIKSWSMLWIFYFYSIFITFLKKNSELTILNIIIISQLCIYIVIYIFYKGFDPDSSIERLLIHLAPLAIYYVAITVYMEKAHLLKVFHKLLSYRKNLPY